jgi:hypothetical protein
LPGGRYGSLIVSTPNLEKAFQDTVAVPTQLEDELRARGNWPRRSYFA